MGERSLQETYAPAATCFGCGPANERGLKIKSYARGDRVVADWTPQPHHQAFPNVLNGGIIGALLDCHCNWTACHHLMMTRGAGKPPCTVTAEYSISLKRPTPMDGPVHLSARVVHASDDRATVEGELTANGKLCATCRGVFVAVELGHPAYHRW
jgi:acyl-coenzyme A thioesterase PaaI-like protein